MRVKTKSGRKSPTKTTTMQKGVITKVAREMGLKRVDAKRSMSITVRKGDITKATKKNHKSCAFAQACMRQYGAKNVFFLRTTAYVQKGKKLERFKLSPSVQKEIVSFDRTANMEPGVYQLTKPSKSSRMGTLRSRVNEHRDKNRKHGAGKARYIHRMTGVRGQVIA